MVSVKNDKDSPMLISRFSDAQGRRYWLLVNLDMKKNISATMQLAERVTFEQCSFNGNFVPIQAVTEPIREMVYGGYYGFGVHGAWTDGVVPRINKETRSLLRLTREKKSGKIRL